MTATSNAAATNPVGPARHLPLTGVRNLRDAGGYATADGRAVRWRTLLRWDSLHELDEEGRTALRDLGLRTVVDLRSPMEIERWPNVFAATDAPRYLHRPLSPTPAGTIAAPSSEQTADLEVIYRRFVDQSHEGIGAALIALSEQDAFPALVHCMAGKDRTGLVVALLLAIAGVPHETIAEDYALTARYLDAEFVSGAAERAGTYGYSAEQFTRLLACPPEFMLGILDYVGVQYGGVEGYCARIGLSDANMTAIRAALVE